MGNTKPIPLSRLEMLCCDQATVAMRPCAGLAGAELALLSRGSTTCGTSDSEYLLRGEFFFHSRGRILQAFWPSLHASAPSQGFRLKRFFAAGASADVGSSTVICSLRSVWAMQSISANGVRCGLYPSKAISKLASFRL